METEPPRATPFPPVLSPRGTAESTLGSVYYPQLEPPSLATLRPWWHPYPLPCLACPHQLPLLTLVVIWDVVGGFSVDEKGWQAQWLVGLIPQADVVVPWEGGRARWLGPTRSPHTLSLHCPEPKWPHLTGWQRQVGSGAPRTCHPPQRLRCAMKPEWVVPPVGSDWV